MLIQFSETSRAAVRGNNQPPGSLLREGASRNSYSSSRDHGDAEFRDSVVFYVLGILFLTPLILAGIAVKFG